MGKPHYKLNPSDHIDYAIAELVKSIREHLNIPLESLAEQIGLDQKQLKLREEGQGPFTASELYNIAGVFRLPVACLYSGVVLNITDIDTFLRFALCEMEMIDSIYSQKTPKEATRLTRKIIKEISVFSESETRH